MAQRDTHSQDSCEFLCNPDLLDRIDSIAQKQNVNREEAIRQLLYIGLGEVGSGQSN